MQTRRCPAACQALRDSAQSFFIFGAPFLSKNILPLGPGKESGYTPRRMRPRESLKLLRIFLTACPNACAPRSGTKTVTTLKHQTLNESAFSCCSNRLSPARSIKRERAVSIACTSVLIFVPSRHQNRLSKSGQRQPENPRRQSLDISKD